MLRSCARDGQSLGLHTPQAAAGSRGAVFTSSVRTAGLGHVYNVSSTPNTEPNLKNYFLSE